MNADEGGIVEIVKTLMYEGSSKAIVAKESIRLDSFEVGNACALLNKKERMHELREGGRGEILHNQMNVSKDKKISVVAFCEWWLLEGE